MSNEADVRRLAMVLPEVTEKTSYGTPAFSVARKIFIRLHDEPGVLICWRADMGERLALLDSDPDKFFTTDHYQGHPSVLVRLDMVDNDELSELIEEAWRARAPRRLLDR